MGNSAATEPLAAKGSAAGPAAVAEGDGISGDDGHCCSWCWACIAAGTACCIGALLWLPPRPLPSLLWLP